MKTSLLVGLLVLLILISLVSSLVAAEEAQETFSSINMTGVNASFLTIGMQGVANSTLSLNTTIIEIGLTGVRVYPVSCSFGLLRPGDIRTTGFDFAIYNASNASANVTIAVSSDWGGSSNWTHSDDCIPGTDVAGLVAIVEDDNGHTSVIVRKTEPYNYLATDLAVGEIRRFALELYAPTEFSDYSSAKRNSIFITVEDQ